MPEKLIKRGYKIWMICYITSYACQFEIYTGKISELAEEKKLAERVVNRSYAHLFLEKLFMNNFFSSYNSRRFLETQKFFCCEQLICQGKTFQKIS